MVGSWLARSQFGRHLALVLTCVFMPSLVEAWKARSEEEVKRHLAWAGEWLITEFNVSTLPFEDQMQEMEFFIKKAAPYEGMEIRVVSEDITTHRYERDVMAAAFRNITGINVVHEIRDESEVVKLLSQQVATGKNLYDAYVSDSDLIGTHWRSCGVTAISDWVLGDGANVTLPSLDIHDFIGIDFVTAPDGKVYMLPDQQFANLYWFRYDLFTDPDIKALFRHIYRYELGIPLDWTAYENIADFFTNVVREVNGTRIYGHMDYGKNEPSLGWRFHDAWLSMAGAGDTGEPNGLPVDEWGIRSEKCRPVGASVERGGAVNSPASIFAATKYIEWLKNYAPPGAMGMNFKTAGSQPSRGNIVQQIFWYTTFTTDLRKSPEVMYPDGRPKWRMAPSPHGPYWEEGMKIGYQDVGSWTLLESTPLERRRAAWLYAQFTVCRSLSLRKTLVGLTPVRESDLWSQAMTDMAPFLGGLVEFYRSPDRVRWSPTGTNVPDYPQLAPLWWKNIGQATLQAANGSDPREEATKAMDKLAHDIDAKLFRIGQESDHPCAPRLNPRRPQVEWLREPGAPKEQLEDEMPRGSTIDYDNLVSAWQLGMSINYDFGPDITRQGCFPNGPVHGDTPQEAASPRCVSGFLLGTLCTAACPETHEANVTTGRCERMRRGLVTHTITNMVDLPLSWGVNEMAFFVDPDCRKQVQNVYEVVSSGDFNVSSRLNAFDGVLATAWISSCSTCPSGSAFIGQMHLPKTVVKCLKVFQSSLLGSVSPRLALRRDGTELAVYQAEGGAWERWPMPGAGVLWRVSNGDMTSKNWVLYEVMLYNDTDCTTRLSPNFTVQSSLNWSGTADHVFDNRIDSSWMSGCARCPVGKAFVELEFDPPLPEDAIQCVKVLQQGSLETINLERWNGQAWETRLELGGLGGGIVSPAHQRPLAPDTMWRLRALALEGPNRMDGWEVNELHMCADDRCAQPLRDFQVIASSECTPSLQAAAAADGQFMSFWAGGDNTQQWIGLWFSTPQQVQCFQIWQSWDRWASQLVMERWNGEKWVETDQLQYGPETSGYFSSCGLDTRGTFWRLTHLEPLSGIWRVHEVEFFTDEACSQLIPDDYVIVANGMPSSNVQNHLLNAMDHRHETFFGMCERYAICNPRTEYIGVHFRSPQAVRCVRVFQSGTSGGLALEERLRAGGLARPRRLQSWGSSLRGSSEVDVVYNQTIVTISAADERWQWFNSTHQSAAADCKDRPDLTAEGWCEECGCLTCSAGSEPFRGSSTQFCHACLAGRFSDSSGLPRCKACELGKFGTSAGQTACETCPAGRFADAMGRTQCKACPTGSKQDMTGQSFCDLCSPGEMAAEEGQIVCEQCAWTSSSVQGSASCSFDGRLLFVAVLLFASVLVASLLFFSALWYAMPIEDVATEDGVTVVKCVGHHWLLSPTNWWWEHHITRRARRSLTTKFPRSATNRLPPSSSRHLEEMMSQKSSGPQTPLDLLDVTPQAFKLARVHLSGTGIRWMEEPPMRLRAIVDTRRRVKLVDEKGEQLKRPVEASIGYLKLQFSEALRMTGFIVPLWVILVSILSLAVGCPIAGHLPWFVWVPEVCGCILLGAAIHEYRSRKVLKTLHRQRLDRYAAILRRRNPNPKPCPRGPGRAVTVGQLWNLYEYFHGPIGDRDMYYVNENILKPLTKKSQLSYAELAGPSELMWYVSHYWGTSFRSFVESVRKHAQSANGNCSWKKGCYWICSLGNNQWKVTEELGQNWDESSFFLALRSPSCRGTAMVIDEDALPLTRSWCLFEVLQTFLLERDVELFKGLWLCTESGILNQGATSVDCVLAVTKRLSSLRLENAQASMESDKTMIDDLVVSELGGFKIMNLFLKKHFQEALVAARNQFEMQFQELADQLAEPLQHKFSSVTDEDEFTVTDEAALELPTDLTLPGVGSSTPDHVGLAVEEGGTTPKSVIDKL